MGRMSKLGHYSNFCFTFSIPSGKQESPEPDGSPVTPSPEPLAPSDSQKVPADSPNLFGVGNGLHTRHDEECDNHGGLEIAFGAGGLSDSASRSDKSRTRHGDTGASLRTLGEAPLARLDRAGDRLHQLPTRVPESDTDRPGMSAAEREGKLSFCSTSLPRMNVSQKPGTNFFRFQPVEGKYEPWYCGIVEAGSEHVLEKWWECPHCAAEFKRRTPCEIHCKGKDGLQATCNALKSGGA